MPATAQTTAPAPAPLPLVAWLPLFSEDHLAHLGLDLAAHRHCDSLANSLPAYYRCLGLEQAPLTLALPLHRAPSRDSTVVGTLLVTAVPDRGLTAAFLPVGAYRAIPFVPDLYDPDWGYGPWFHQSVLAARDGWVELPADPWPEPVWLEPEILFDGRTLRQVTAGDILTTPRGDMVVEGIEANGIRIRPEQPWDGPCESEEKPSGRRETPTAFLMANDELRTTAGHFRFSLKYLRGC